ncbi:nuclease-related domain-containing DEAD/DEAH box helicase [Eubacterium limosum]|uniref:nuclease-related domain-containing DEAD/DEAH box helicase n=1 Tax=Eubacterium limosum TaxID=1736 RepID=UPI001063A67E|nr:NERD domain-containing protein [Eubacterium limosum]
MAKMVPSVISADTKSSAERKVYKWFENAPGTEDWIVLHSLGIARHDTLLEGEVDFLVLVPRKGIFALEVKGGRVKREDGKWCYTDRYGRTSKKVRSPFDQARDAIHSIMGRLPEKVNIKHQKVIKTFYSYGVMFPDIEYHSGGVDEASWQVFDCRDSNNVHNYILRLANGARKNWERVYGTLEQDKIPSKKDVDYLAKILRGNFDKAVAMVARIHNAEEELIELTQQQYRCLDQLDDNPRSVIYGAAGTGKTLLAFEQAKRKTLSGKRVALFCFNKNLAAWFRLYFDNSSKDEKPAFIGTFHQYLVKVIKRALGNISFPEAPDCLEKFYNMTLPERVADVLLENPVDEYDTIIVDEAQDLIKPQFLDIFDLIIKNGFERGNWTMFGDFSNQAIYADRMNARAMMKCLEERTAFIRFKLTINCRNTKQICEEIQTITKSETPSELWNKVDGLPVNYFVCRDTQESCNKLREILDLLKENHISNNMITILSPKKRENSIVEMLNNKNIKNYSLDTDKFISFSTVQGFKGLESSVIILTDIETYTPCQLMYVAFSRARSALYILETEQAEIEHTELMKARLLNGRQ